MLFDSKEQVTYQQNAADPGHSQLVEERYKRNALQCWTEENNKCRLENISKLF